MTQDTSKKSTPVSANHKRNGNFLTYTISLISIFLILASFAILQSGTLFGHDISSTGNDDSLPDAIATKDDHIEINTTGIAGDITGYAGSTPVIIHITKGRIDSIHPLENAETPSFFSRLKSEGLLSSWNGLTPQEALAKKVDAVSGATFSSTSVIKNVQAGLHHLTSTAAEPDTPFFATDSDKWKFILSVIVILSAASIPLITHNGRLRLIQQILNVAVLGFWCGTFVDYAVMTGFIAHKFLFTASSVVTILLLILAFIYPLLGKNNYYCLNVCPFGSMQDLAGRLSGKKWHLNPKVASRLIYVRTIIWCILMLSLWTGIGAEWMANEIFTIFLVESAALSVIVTGSIFILISIFIPRPFCTWVCPTGTILHLAHSNI